MKDIPPTQDETVTIERLCSQYGHDQQNPFVIRNITRCLRAESFAGLKYGRNEALLADTDVMAYENFPSAPMTVACLIGYWKTPRSNDQMPSGQVAKQAQTLRDSGFRFQTEKKADGKTRNTHTFKHNGKECRMIVDFDPKVETKESHWNKLTQKQKKAFRSVCSTDFLGINSLSKDRQIDHRIPEDVRKREGLKVARLTEQSIKDGSYDQDFQVLSATGNCRKREACNACLKGELIPLPFAVEPFRDAYRQRYEESSTPCAGCFWHNHLTPKNENLCPNLSSARLKHRQEVQQVQLTISKVK